MYGGIMYKWYSCAKHDKAECTVCLVMDILYCWSSCIVKWVSDFVELLKHFVWCYEAIYDIIGLHMYRDSAL